jgi:hypothetical protein
MDDGGSQRPGPNAPAYSGGTGNFAGAPGPGPATQRSSFQVRTSTQTDGSAEREKPSLKEKLGVRIKRLGEDVGSRNDFRALRQKIYKKGGKWEAENGITFGVTEQGWIYQHLAEYKEGVAQTTIVALDANPPFIAIIATDLQGVTPKKREALLKELSVMAKRRRKPRPSKPSKPTGSAPTSPGPELVHVVEKDWLSKISLTRWKTTEWFRYLEPTQMTLDARAKKGETFDPDLIFEGDTFEVIGSGGAGGGAP